jgi:hypothetical protein
LSFEDFFKKETAVTKDGLYTLEFIVKLDFMIKVFVYSNEENPSSEIA